MTSTEIAQINANTIAAFAEPKVGDRFEEFCSYWVIVIKIDEGGILTYQKSGCSEEKLKRYASGQEFRDAFSFSGRSQYWIKLYSRDYDVSQILLDL
jgi:hypothetical protein